MNVSPTTATDKRAISSLFPRPCTGNTLRKLRVNHHIESKTDHLNKFNPLLAHK